MKISNFRLIKVTGNSILDYKFKALVTVETGIFFKKRKDKEVYKEGFDLWRFVDSGKFTPGFKVEDLVRSFKAKHMKELEHCPIYGTSPHKTILRVIK